MLDPESALPNLALRVLPHPNATGAGPASIALPAAKHFDPVVGVDIHLERVPPATPVPNPFIGFLFDPFDYIPFIGATVYVNGVPRAQAGTAGVRMPPHEPILAPFVKEPENECEMLMGSMTVAVDADAFSYMALPALSCNDLGIRAPWRKKSPPVAAMVLPTSIVIAIPMGPPVLVGGLPTISLMALGMRAGMALLGEGLAALAKTGRAKSLGSAASGKAGALQASAAKKLAPALEKLQPLTKKIEWLATKADGILNDPFFPRKVEADELRRKPSPVNGACTQVGHPVDVITGACVDELDDFVLPGPAPLVWKRYYDSRWAGRPSPAGRGFRFGIQRQLRRHEGGFTLLDGKGDAVELPALAHHDDVVSGNGLRLRKLRGGFDGATDGEIYEVEGSDGVMRFGPSLGEQPSAMEQLRVEGRTWTLRYDTHGRLRQLEDDASRRLSLGHDAWGHVTEIVDEHDPAAPVVLARYRYDAEGRMVEHRDAYDRTSTVAYDDEGRMTRIEDGNGYAFHYRYDAAGCCVHSWGDEGMFDVCLAYDREGRETRVRWPDGGEWRYRYDEHGVLSAIVDPDGWSRRFVSDAQGRVVRQVDEAGNAATLLYDGTGRHIGRRDPLGYLAAPIDESPTLPDPLGYSLPANPRAWRWGGLVGPRPTRAVEPRLGHDKLGRVREEHDAYGVERWQHDATGNVVGHRDRDGRVTRLRYGAWNQLRELVDAEGGSTTLDSDFRGNVTRIEDPGGAVHEYVYDRNERLVAVHRDGALMERYRWDRSGNLVEKLGGDGQTLLLLEAGPGNLMKERRLASGEVQRFEHDARGRVVRASTEALVVERGYDARGRVTRDVRDGQGVEHEQRGRTLVATRWFGRFEVRYEHESDGSMTITDPTGGRHRIELGHDGTLTRRLGNGTVEHLRYDERGSCTRSEVRTREVRTREVRTREIRTREIRTEDEPAPSPWVREYRCSGHGDLLGVSDSERGSSSYRYDGAHRLVEALHASETHERYRWDAAGNLLEQPGLQGVEVGPGNRLRAASGERLIYDDRLRLCRRESAAGAAEYRYDSLDRLVAVERDRGRWSASYDPLCRRTSKTWKGKTTTYHWDDFRLGAERDDAGTLRIYVYPDLESLVPMMFVEYPSAEAEPSAGRMFFLFTDQIGAPLCVQDECGQVVWRARMRPFGGVEVEAGSTIELSLRFPGHLHDPETGLHFNRFRSYDPRLGRYLQPDPLGVVGGLNVYRYCPSPLSTVDLDGLWPCSRRRPAASPRVEGPNHQPSWWERLTSCFGWRRRAPEFQNHHPDALPMEIRSYLEFRKTNRFSNDLQAGFVEHLPLPPQNSARFDEIMRSGMRVNWAYGVDDILSIGDPRATKHSVIAVGKDVYGAGTAQIKLDPSTEAYLTAREYRFKANEYREWAELHRQGGRPDADIWEAEANRLDQDAVRLEAELPDGFLPETNGPMTVILDFDSGHYTPHGARAASASAWESAGYRVEWSTESRHVR